MRTLLFHADKEDALASLSDDVGGLWCRPVAVLDSPPDAFTFLRDFVHPNVPCIIKNAIPSDDGGAACPLTLTLDEIINYVDEDAKITVDVTPDGHGDCIRSVLLDANNHENAKQQQRQERRMFVKPHEKNMEIGKFRDLLRRGSRGCGYDRTDSTNDKVNNGSAAEVVPRIDSNGHEVFPLRHPSNCTDTEHSDTESFFDEVGCPPVVYYSRQNDCLRTEISKLFATQLFPTTFPFAEQAFGTGPPDAINLWIGNERSVSSMHKDHYENLFYVCAGQKEFVLCPPADVVFLEEGEFSSGTFCPINNTPEAGGNANKPNQSSWIVVADDNSDNREDGSDELLESKTRWIEPDIKKYMENTNNVTKEFPLLSKSHPIKILVSEGEMLYIPSLWYHRVTQTCETVGVNYWYDMKFDSPHWCYFNFLQNLSKAKVAHHYL